ncbi:MAG: Ig-like domain-containing protein [Pseudomonadota bacterium]
MKTKLRMGQIAKALVLAGIATVATPASAIEYWLRAEQVNVNMPGPDGTSVSVPMWGYALTDSSYATGTATVPGQMLSVPPGDTVLTIHLKNNLPANTSIVIPGQVTTMTPVWDDGSSGARPSPTARVVSFTHEALAGGGVADYTWANVKPGTYLYQSGTHPQVQVQMGLYGGVGISSAAGQAYPGVAYDNELPLLFSEIDPALHAAVASGAYGTAPAPTSTLNYQPQYFLINGKPFVAGDPPIATLVAGQKTLLRFINAGLQTRVPVINGQYMQMIAEDGNPYPWPANPREQYSVLLPAAKTVDAVLTAQAAGASGRYTIYDRRLGLTNGAAQDGGMLATLEVTGGGGAPTITSAPVTAATQDVLYNYQVAATDPDGGTLAYSLVSAPAGMSIGMASGLIAWTPGNAQVGTQAVTVQATDPTGLFTTQSFDIAVANVNDPPLAQNNAYQMVQGGTLNVAASGVLANDSDPDVGDTITAVNFGAVTPTGGTLAGNADGSFAFTPPATYTGTKSFTYQARDNNGADSNVATVAVTVSANRPPLARDDTVGAPMRRLTPYTAVVISVLANDSDPDTAIDPSNVINPASVSITTAPNKGGTVVVNANGTLSYTPKVNFRGTEVFRYRVKDNLGANSNAAYVRVNVK